LSTDLQRPYRPHAGLCASPSRMYAMTNICMSYWSYTQMLWMRVKGKAAYLPG